MQTNASWSGLVMDSNDPQQLARFWAEVLGYVVVEDSPGWVELMDPSGRRPHFTCQGINSHVQHGAATPQGNKFHLDLGLGSGTDSDPRAMPALSERLERLGAQRIERIGPPGQTGHWVWADPEGNVFCAPGRKSAASGIQERVEEGIHG